MSKSGGITNPMKYTGSLSAQNQEQTPCFENTTQLPERRSVMRKSSKKNRWMTVSVFLAAMSEFVPAAFSRDGGDENQVNFSLTDTPGRWFDTGVDIAGPRSLAVAPPGVRVNFSGNSNTVHTRSSLIFPTGAANMPFTTEPRKGGNAVTLTTPGLYVFTCSIHPYMFGAVIVDDP